MLEKQSGSICAIRNISASFEPINNFVRFYGTSMLQRSLCKYLNILAVFKIRLLRITNNASLIKHYLTKPASPSKPCRGRHSQIINI